MAWPEELLTEAERNKSTADGSCSMLAVLVLVVSWWAGVLGLGGGWYVWSAGGRIERGLVQLNLVQYPKYVLGWIGRIGLDGMGQLLELVD